MGNSKKPARILTFDLLRGLFLVVIFVDHLAYAPSLFFQFATGTTGAFASAAEGFFAVSGILVGYIYGPKILKNTKTVAIKLWRRALLLYGLTVGFTLFYTAWATLLPDGYARQPNWQGSVGDLLFNTATLQFHFGWADFLARYAIFMVFAPLVLWLIAKHRAWVVAIISTSIWWLWRDTPGGQIFTAWQVIFMISIIIGYYLPTIEEHVRSWKEPVKTTLWWIAVSIAGVSYLAIVVRFSILPFFIPGLSSDPSAQWLSMFDRDSLEALRISTGIVWFGGLYLLLRRFEQEINRFTMGTLLLLGQNSLFVYSFEALVIFSIDIFIPAPIHINILLNTIVGVAGISVVYIATRYRKLPTRVYNRNNEVT